MTRLDWFSEVTEEMISARGYLNVHPYRNELSPYMRAGKLIDAVPKGSLIVDRLYGQAYDRIPACGAGIYGTTSDMPAVDLDDKADMGFLRIPFSRVRQAREYLIERSPYTRDCLFGDPDALEPSLLPSGTRAGLDLEAVLPEWAAFFEFCG